MKAEGTYLQCVEYSRHLIKNFRDWSFPGGSEVKNPPAEAGDMGSIPDLGRPHTPRNNEARGPQLLSLSPRAWELRLLSTCAPSAKAHMPGAHALQQETPLQ